MIRLWKVEGLTLSPVDSEKQSFLFLTSKGKRMGFITHKHNVYYSFDTAKDHIRQEYLDLIKGTEQILSDLKDELIEFERLQPKNFK